MMSSAEKSQFEDNIGLLMSQIEVRRIHKLTKRH